MKSISNILKKCAENITSGQKINLTDVADFLGQAKHVFESIEKGGNTGSGEDPIEIIKKEKYSKWAKECQDQINELLRRKKSW